ncbi:hypothetical protein ACUNWD_05535 [Sunxiuqinia sp. A32]|uniref:hypothetical protein n=1 Tax=Sunxiuqinia sp. A32 TaxID=3461496 RepID=UPI0040454B3F
MKSIKSIRELELMKDNLNYKVLHLEEKLKGHSEEAISAVTHQLKEIAFEAGMKIILKLFFRNRENEKESK